MYITTPAATTITITSNTTTTTTTDINYYDYYNNKGNNNNNDNHNNYNSNNKKININENLQYDSTFMNNSVPCNAQYCTKYSDLDEGNGRTDT